MRTFSGLVTAACLALTCGCASSDAGGIEDEVDVSEAALTGTERAKKIAEALGRRGGLVMPPEGRAGGANEMTARVELLSSTSNLAKLLEERAKPAVKGLGGNPDAGFVSLAAHDVHYTIQFGFEDATIKRTLLDTVAPAGRAKVRGLLGAGATYARFGGWDGTSEVIGYEVLLVRPFDAKDKVIVVEIRYMQS